jgi:hypothetical protein
MVSRDADTLEIPLTSANRDPDKVAALRNHYRLEQLQADLSVRDARIMCAGDLHLAILGEIAANAEMLAEGYRAELDAIRSRAQREEVSNERVQALRR